MNAVPRTDASAELSPDVGEAPDAPLGVELATSSPRVRAQLLAAIDGMRPARFREVDVGERPDLVIVDGDDGGAGAAMRSARRRGGLPVVVMSVGQLPASFTEDAVHVLPKPVTVAALVQAADKVRALVAAGLAAITLEVALRDDDTGIAANGPAREPTAVAIESPPRLVTVVPRADPPTMTAGAGTAAPRTDEADRAAGADERVYASAARDLARTPPDPGDDSDAARRLRLRDHVLCGGALVPGDPGASDAVPERDEPYRPERYIGAVAAAALRDFRRDPSDGSGRAALAMNIEIAGFTVQVLPDVDRVYTSVSLGRLHTVRELFQPHAAEAYRVSRCSPEEVAGLQSELMTRARGGYSIEAFLWLAALMSSRGRLPEGADVARPRRLARWPNLTRLELLPGCLQLSRRWHREPRSIDDLRRTSGLPERFVHAFYNAASALDLFEATV